jgi:hypothetical protein
MDQIQVCTLPVHALLHVPYDIRATGPVSGCWSWVMERFCGILGIVATKGRRFPNSVIANRMLQHALVLFFDAQYDLGLRRLFRTGRMRDHDEERPGYIDGSKFTPSSLLISSQSVSGSSTLGSLSSTICSRQINSAADRKVFSGDSKCTHVENAKNQRFSGPFTTLNVAVE